MPWMPGVRHRKIDWANNLSRGGVRPNAVVLHVSAGESTSLYGFFSGIRYACSHFHVARDGTIEQYAGTGARSAADRSSKRTISVETQGADAGGRWTSAQVEALARIVAWCHQEHDIPLRLMNSSHLHEHGVGWHRLGVDGNFPSTGILAGRLQRRVNGTLGESWSGSRGKVCPGDARIQQIPAVLARAKQLAGAGTVSKPVSGGGNVTVPTPPSAPAPITPKEGFLMALTDEQQTRLYNTLVAGDGVPAAWVGKLMDAVARLDKAMPEVERNATLLGRLRPGKAGVGHQGDLWPLVAAALNAPRGEGDLDPQEFAAAIADAIPTDLAQRVVSELSNRLQGA